MWTDQEYAERIFSSLPKYRKHPGTFKLNARCPVCGDSATDEHKARFWAGEFKGGVRVKCYNCDYSEWLGNFIKDHYSGMYASYLMDKRREDMIYNKDPVKAAAPVKKYEQETIGRLPFCTRLDKLNPEHPIVKYVKKRMIPEDKWDRLWFTVDWQKLVNAVNPGTYKHEKAEPRLVIPIFNKEKDIESFQGRALAKDAKAKYMTVKANPESSKVYGLDTMTPNKPCYFMEGPIDSLFVENSGAITGGSLALSEVPYPAARVWVMDHEPRSKETLSRMAKLIRAGEKIVLWDKSPWQEKDINAMIVKEGATREQIQDYLERNTVSGLMAKLRFEKYAKVPYE